MDSGTLMTIVSYFAIFFLFFWVFAVWPRKRQDKKHTSMVESLTRGERVVTIGGIKGEIVKIKDKFIILKVAEDTEIEILAKAVAYRVEDD